MASVIQEKLGYAEIEARKRKERLLQLKKKVHGQSDVDAGIEPENGEVEETFMPSIQDVQEDLNPAAHQQSDELDLSNLAPRKIDWDLKRGIAKSLEILQERTNEVISEMVNERLEENETD